MADTEREAFEAWVRKDTGMPDWARFNWQAEWVQPALEGWMARAALASRPAEVDDSMAETYRDAIATVCEGWTLPADARKVLEKALWAAPSHTTNKEKGGADGHVLDR